MIEAFADIKKVQIIPTCTKKLPVQRGSKIKNKCWLCTVTLIRLTITYIIVSAEFIKYAFRPVSRLRILSWSNSVMRSLEHKILLSRYSSPTILAFCGTNFPYNTEWMVRTSHTLWWKWREMMLLQKLQTQENLHPIYTVAVGKI